MKTHRNSRADDAQNQYATEGTPMRVKNGFLTFCFACIPGAGQMYQGYMKRGLSMVTLFGVSCMLTGLISMMIVFACILVMYSFFDTFNLRAQLLAGTAPEDDYLVHLDVGAKSPLGRLLHSSHKLVGWALVALGVYALYDNFLRSIAYELWGDPRFQWLANLLDRLPTLVLCAGLILVGLWLVRGPKAAFPDEDIPHYGAGPATGPDASAQQSAGPVAPFGMGAAPAAPEPPRPFARQPWVEQAAQEQAENTVNNAAQEDEDGKHNEN